MSVATLNERSPGFMWHDEIGADEGYELKLGASPSVRWSLWVMLPPGIKPAVLEIMVAEGSRLRDILVALRDIVVAVREPGSPQGRARRELSKALGH